MAQAQGALARIAYNAETTWGTPVTSGAKIMKALTYGESLGADVEELISNSVNGNRAVEAILQGKIDVKGNLPFEVAPLGIGTLLYHALGGKTTTGTGPYTHVLKRAALPVGLTFEKGFTDLGQYFQFRGCKINSLAFSLGPTGFATGTLDIVGKDFATSASSVFTSPTVPVHTPFLEANVTALEGGGAATLLNLSCTITNELDAVNIIGSRTIGAVTEGKGNTTGEITVMFDSMTTFNKWLNSTSSNLKATFASGSNSLELFFPSITYVGDAIPKIANAQGVIVPLKFRATYDAVTELTDVKVTLINTESAL